MLQESEKEKIIPQQTQILNFNYTMVFSVYNLYSLHFHNVFGSWLPGRPFQKRIAKDNPALLAASAHEELLPVHLSWKSGSKEGIH